jgi:hypothetical protein
MHTRRKPTEAEIQEVMAETKMDPVQAYHHLVQRYYLSEQLSRNPQKEFDRIHSKA